MIRQRLEKTTEASGFVLRKRRDTAVAADLLRELTRILPDGTWLSQLSMKDGSVDLRGESTDASALDPLADALARIVLMRGELKQGGERKAAKGAGVERAAAV